MPGAGIVSYDRIKLFLKKTIDIPKYFSSIKILGKRVLIGNTTLIVRAQDNHLFY